MVNGDSTPQQLVAKALKRERNRAGLSISEVARRADIAKSTLSQLESGLGNPSLETLWALGNALGVPFSQLVDAPSQPVQLIRAGDGPAIASATASYIAVGWVAVAAMPQLFSHRGLGLPLLLLAGGILYTLGAVSYATKRPNPWPRTYGFHEVFHTLVIAAAVVHFVAIAGRASSPP